LATSTSRLLPWLAPCCRRCYSPPPFRLTRASMSSESHFIQVSPNLNLHDIFQMLFPRLHTIMAAIEVDDASHRKFYILPSPTMILAKLDSHFYLRCTKPTAFLSSSLPALASAHNLNFQPTQQHEQRTSIFNSEKIDQDSHSGSANRSYFVREKSRDAH
jgi:hypothetical protein